MEIKLDYQRMADTVYAMAALKTFETGAERIIGRREEAALTRMFEHTLLEISLSLGAAVKSVNVTAGKIEIDAEGPTVHQMLEAAVTGRVLEELRLTDDDPQPYLDSLRGMTRKFPKLAQN